MPKKPNLIFIFSDQQHFRAIGCRDPFFQTPHWDAFASGAVRFDTVYCPTPLCSPSRGSLMTGRCPWENGVVDNGLHLGEPNIGAFLQSAGYHTAYFGKWHLGDDPVATAGWDEKAGVYNEYVAPNRPLSDAETEDFARNFLGHAAGLKKPFALFVSFDQPHGVYWANPHGAYPRDFLSEPVVSASIPLPESWRLPCEQPADQPWSGYATAMRANSWSGLNNADGWRRYRAVYRECVRQFDERLGRMLDDLRQRGLYDNSLIIVTSDHGDMDAHHGLAFKGPLPFEELQRVPLAVKVPGGRAGRVDASSIVSLLDLWPTILEYAGTRPTPRAGFSLKPLLDNAATHHARVEALIQYPQPNVRTIRRENWKYSLWPDGLEWLFDLRTDPHEMVNLAGDPTWARIKSRLRERLAQAWPSP